MINNGIRDNFNGAIFQMWISCQRVIIVVFARICDTLYFCQIYVTASREVYRTEMIYVFQKNAFSAVQYFNFPKSTN